MSSTFAVPASSPLSFVINRVRLASTLSPSIPAEKSGLQCAQSGAGRSRSLCLKVKALHGSVLRPTISSGWDLSPSTSPLLPEFENLDATNMLLRQRIVFIGSQIDDMTADFIVSQLLLLDAQDSTRDITIFINSPGGSTTAGMAIYDAMKLCKADVSTMAFGMAASMGAFILASGTKGKRFCMPNAKVMIQQPNSFAEGFSTTTDMTIRTRETGYIRVKISKIMSRITGKSESQIDADMRIETFMNPWEAKEYGLVDAVIDDGKPGLVAPIVDSSPPRKTYIWPCWEPNGIEDPELLPSEEKLLLKAGE